MTHSAMSPNNIAVITGGASGIGLAAAMRFAGCGMKVCIADLGTDRLAEAGAKLAAAAPDGAANIMAKAVDVSRFEEMSELEAAVRERFGGTDILMNNAGVQPGSGMFGPSENWERILGVNLWGVIHGTQVFAPRMIARGRPGLIINTGSKQGITTPPGDPAYNVSKAGVKAFTEALQHELRNASGGRISAHLLIPGFVFTGADRQGSHREAGGGLDTGADRRLHDRAARGRRFLHPVSGQRRAALARRATHPLGGRRHRREPARAVALASGLCGGVCGVCEGELTSRSFSYPNPLPFRGAQRDDALEPGRSLQGGLLARRAGVHVDFHPNRDFNDLRCFPGHFDFSNVAARMPNGIRFYVRCSDGASGLLSPIFENGQAGDRKTVGSVPQIWRMLRRTRAVIDDAIQRLPFDNRIRRRIDTAFPNSGRVAR